MYLIDYVTEGLQSGFKISLELKPTQCESPKDKDFIKILLAKLGINETEVSLSDSSKEDKVEETKLKLDPINSLALPVTYNLLFPFQIISSLDTLDKIEKEDLLKLLESYNSPEEFFSIISKMKPGDEVIFRINDREIIIKKISQSQTSISESVGEFEIKEIPGTNLDRDVIDTKGTNRGEFEIPGTNLDRDVIDTKGTSRGELEIPGTNLDRDVIDTKKENPVIYEKQGNITSNPTHNGKGEDIEVFEKKKEIDLKVGSDTSDTKDSSYRKVDKTAKTSENDSNFNSMHLRADRAIPSIDHSLQEENTNFSEKIVRLISERITGDSKTGEAILKLHPDSSGEVRVRIFLEDERLNIRLMVSNEKLRDFIESNIDSLKRGLFEKGLELGSVSVYIMGESGMSSYRRDRDNRFNFTYPYKEGNKKIEVVEVRSIGNLIDLIV